MSSILISCPVAEDIIISSLGLSIILQMIRPTNPMDTSPLPMSLLFGLMIVLCGTKCRCIGKSTDGDSERSMMRKKRIFKNANKCLVNKAFLLPPS